MELVFQMLVYVNHCVQLSAWVDYWIFSPRKLQVTYNKYSFLQVPTTTEYSLDGESYRFQNMGINHSFTASSGNIFIVLKFWGLYINAITFLCKLCITLYILNNPLVLGAYWSCWVDHSWWIKGEAANKGLSQINPFWGNGAVRVMWWHFKVPQNPNMTLHYGKCSIKSRWWEPSKKILTLAQAGNAAYAQ
jgi:hypothetical protein